MTYGMKLFHISDVLSITTGRLVSTRHMQGVYEILNYMTGENLYTHQLPRASRECAPAILAAHPDLATITVPDDLADDGVRGTWLRVQAKRFGWHVKVPRLPKREPQYDTPIADAIEMMGDPTKVIVLDV